jgi:hypothetical protein
MRFSPAIIYLQLFCLLLACKDPEYDVNVVNPNPPPITDNSAGTLELSSLFNVLCEGNASPISIKLNGNEVYYWNVHWKIEPSLGQMQADRYKAPLTFNGVKEIKITATLNENSKTSGSIILKLEANESNTYIRAGFFNSAPPYDIQFLKDGHLLLTSSYVSSPAQMELFKVLKLNSLGQKVWERNLELGHSRIIEVNNENIFVAGFLSGQGNVIVKMDHNGNVIAKRNLGNVLIQAIEVDDTGQVYIGYREILGELNFIGHLAKLDNALELMWDKSIGLRFIFDIIKSDDESFFFTFHNTTYDPHSIMGLFDCNGEILWEKNNPLGNWSLKNIQKNGSAEKLIAVFTERNDDQKIKNNVLIAIDREGTETNLLELYSSQFGQAFTIAQIIHHQNQSSLILLCNYIDRLEDGTIPHYNFKLLFVDYAGSLHNEWMFEKVPYRNGQYFYSVTGLRIHQNEDNILILGNPNYMFLLKMGIDLNISACQRRNVII